MERHELQKILESKYDQSKWFHVLKDWFGVRQIYQVPQRIPDKDNQDWRDYVENAFELGRLNTDSGEREVGIFEVNLTPKAWIERNRVKLRSLLNYLYKEIDAALIVFTQGDKWRFSYVSEIRVYNEEGNFVKQETEPKRYTYLFGRDENSRTATQRFETLRGKPLTLRDLLDAFSVEKLNQEFFDEYSKVFHEVEEAIKPSIPDVKANDEDAKEKRRLYTQRLFNRLMFIYFLQKKGWLSFEGDNNYLRCLFEEAKRENKNFLDDRLFWLFFSGLGYSENPDLHNSRLMRQRRGDVEYLNGGLFEKDKDGFDKQRAVFIDNKYFEKVLGLFERFNFTVDESTPIDIEVAVDPEMLGKVFEELVTGRQESGSYYTPRQIVSFMCRESLKYHLKSRKLDADETIDDFVDKANGEKLKNPENILSALKQITVCDPACGSGAYLLGMMQELLRLRQAVFASKNIGNEKIYDDKLEIIENNIYGVDKDPFAVQIASLRLWLSLSIDSDKPKPLPNLKYKIGCGDALLAPLEKDSNLFRKPLIEEFRKQKARHIKANKPEDRELKQELEIDIERLKVKIAQSLYHLPEPTKPQNITIAENEVARLLGKVKEKLKENKADSKYYAEDYQKKANILQAQIDEWKGHLNIQHYSPNFFDWTVEFAEVFVDGGFDVVLANPPYIQLQKDGGRLAKLYEKQNFGTFARTGDIYSLFYERGFGLLKENGVLCFITSNKWMRANYGERMRKFFADKTKPLLIVDFGSVKIFGSATVDNNILILQKAERKTGEGVFAVRTEKDYDLSDNLADYVKSNGYHLSSISQNSWVIGEKDEFDIKNRVEKQGIALKDSRWKISINYGIKTGFNEAFIIPGNIKKQIEDNAKQNGNDKSTELFKRMLRGKDIKAWFPEFENLWLINTHNGVKSEEIKRIDVEKSYPAVFEHLKQYETSLINRLDKGDHWTNLRNCAYLSDFERPKIIYPNMTKYLPFVYDDTGFYTNDKNYIITGESLKYLTCFFNSKIFKYCFSDNFPNLGEDRRELRKVFFQEIPVKKISADEEKPFNWLVDCIVFLKRRIQKLRTNGDQKDELAMSLFFEQLSDALILETYLAEDFQKADISIKKHLPEFAPLEKPKDEKDAELAEENSLQTIRDLYKRIEHYSHPLRVNLSAIKSIPAVQVIYNTVRF